MVTHKVPSIWITWLTHTRKDDTQTITLVSSLWILTLSLLQDNDAHFICCPTYLGRSKFNQATFFLWYIPTFHCICMSRESLVSIDTSKHNKDRDTLYCFTMIKTIYNLCYVSLFLISFLTRDCLILDKPPHSPNVFSLFGNFPFLNHCWTNEREQPTSRTVSAGPRL